MLITPIITRLQDIPTRAHASLTSLSTDDHTQYGLLAGRSGGQTYIGDTASGGNLTLQSTAHATRGSVKVGTMAAFDEVNNRLGVGIQAPLTTVHVTYDANTVGGITPRGILGDSIDATPHGFHFEMRKARGTRAAKTAMLSGDFIGGLVGYGYDGTSYLENAAVGFFVNGAVSAGVLPTTAYFFITDSSGNGKRQFVAHGNGVSFGAIDVPLFALHGQSTGTNFVCYDQYSGDTSAAAYIGRKARGSSSAPSAVLSGDALTGLFARGHDGSNYSSSNTGSIIFLAAENFTNAAQGTHCEIRTCPTGTVASGTGRLRITSQGNVVIGNGGSPAALATNATDGFLYIPSCAGTPTGTPTSFSPTCPLVYDTTNNKLYAYNAVGAAWKSVTLA